VTPNAGSNEQPGGTSADEIARLTRELDADDAERRRLQVELDEIRHSPVGPLIGPARTLRSVIERRTRRLRRRLSSRPGTPRPATAEGDPGRRLFPPRRLSPQFSGSELAWLVRRRLRRRAAGRWRPGPAVAAEPWLAPVLVDFFGRDGSTAMMALLASSPEIVIDEKYPYERRYFTYLWRWSRLLSRTDWPHALWTKDDVVSLAQEREGSTLVGPPPWLPRDLLDAPEEPPIAQRCFEFAWRELSTRAVSRVSGGKAPRYYAEKHGNTWLVDARELPPVKLIVLLRDPRDTHASIRAFEDSEPVTSFGIHHIWAGDHDPLTGILDRHRQRLRWIIALLAEDDAPVIRYEELVADTPSVARRLERYLEVELDPDVLRSPGLIGRHATSDQGGSERWRHDLDPETVERFNLELGSELDALGFSR
jgi:Sulfotransferase family